MKNAESIDFSASSSVDLLEYAREGRQDALDVLFARHLVPLRRWAST